MVLATLSPEIAFSLLGLEEAVKVLVPESSPEGVVVEVLIAPSLYFPAQELLLGAELGGPATIAGRKVHFVRAVNPLLPLDSWLLMSQFGIVVGRWGA